ncbi:MAG: hypothetical protein AB7E95_03940 [Kiritimatiellales bacterium]
MELDPLIRLTGVLTACPFGSPLENCIFTPIRQASLSRRMHWLNTLPKKERERLAIIHSLCVARREKDCRSKSPNKPHRSRKRADG